MEKDAILDITKAMQTNLILPSHPYLSPSINIIWLRQKRISKANQY